MIFEPAELARRVRGAAAEGYRLEVHAMVRVGVGVGVRVS